MLCARTPKADNRGKTLVFGTHWTELCQLRQNFRETRKKRAQGPASPNLNEAVKTAFQINRKKAGQ
jgi:hypothetical protein